MKHFFLKRLSLILISSLSLVFIACSGQGGAKPGQSTEQVEPVDETIDDRIDQMQGQDNSLYSEDGDESSMSNEMGSLEKRLNVIYFDFDKFDVRSDMEEMVEENSRKLNSSNYESSNIKLEGNSDEWGSDEYNYSLALKRAKAVKTYLINEGIDESRITIISYGESNPTCSQRNQSCWSKNRRVETKLLP